MTLKLGNLANETINSKDAFKYLKHLLKLFSTLMKNKDQMNAFAASSAINKHYRSLGESIRCLLMRRQEMPTIKDVRLCILVVLPEKVKSGFSSIKLSYDACYLYYWIILAGIEEKEFSLISVANNSTILKLQEAKTEIEIILEQELNYFGLSVSKIKPNKPMYFKSSMTDTKICPFLYLPVSSPPETEIELIMEQILIAYTTATLVKACQRLKNLRHRTEEDRKVEKEDMALMTCIKLLFADGLHRLPLTDNIALKCVFIDALRDTRWFWSVTPCLNLALYKLLIPNILVVDSMYLLSSCHRKLAMKLAGNYYCKSPDLKESQIKILEYFDTNLSKFLEIVLNAANEEKYRSIRPEILTDLQIVMNSCLGIINKENLMTTYHHVMSILKSSAPKKSKPLDCDYLSSLFKAVDFHSPESFMLATKVFYRKLSQEIETFPKNGMRSLPSAVQTLTVYVSYFSSFPFSSTMITAMCYNLASLVLSFISEGQYTQLETKSLSPVMTAFRHCLEVATLSRGLRLIKHAYNELESMDALIRESAALIKIIAKILYSVQPSDAESIAMDIAMTMRLIDDKDAEKSLYHVIENSVLRASMSNVLFFKKLADKSPIENYENVMILSCFGLDTMELFVRHRREQLKATKCLKINEMFIDDTRIVDFYRTKIKTRDRPSIDETDFFLSDGKSILQVKDGELIARTEGGMYSWKFIEGSLDHKAMMNLLFLHGWLPPDLYSLNKSGANFDKLITALDEKDSQIEVKIGCVILPDIKAVGQSMRANEDFEKLLVRHSEEKLTPSVQRILEHVVGELPQFVSTIASNHLVKASLVTASLYDQGMDRFLDLKRKLGHCEVNICIDEFNICSHLHLRSQLFKSNLTMIEIIASKLEKDCWCITTKPREGISDELKRLQAAIGSAYTSKQGKDFFSAFEFNKFWLKLDARSPPKFFCREQQVPDILKQLAIFYSLALKDAIGILHDPKASRRLKIADILAKSNTEQLTHTEYIECFQFK